MTSTSSVNAKIQELLNKIKAQGIVINVFENSGGVLFLAICWNGDLNDPNQFNCYCNYDHPHDLLLRDIKELAKGDFDPNDREHWDSLSHQEWLEMVEKSQQSQYSGIIDGGIVLDMDGIYPDKMGAAAESALLNETLYEVKEPTIQDFIEFLVEDEKESISEILGVDVEDVDVPLVQANFSEILRELCGKERIAKDKNSSGYLPIFYLVDYQDGQVVITEDPQNNSFEIESAEPFKNKDGVFDFEIYLKEVFFNYADYDENCPPEEYMVIYGYEPDLNVAEETDTDVKVWCRFFFYDGTWNAPTNRFARDECNNIIEFETYAEAKAYVKEQKAGKRVLVYNEYSPPEYVIVKN